jgi:putative aldouronate transport system substrate-binding protein
MKNKKFVAVLSILLVLCMVFGGCGKKTKETDSNVTEPGSTSGTGVTKESTETALDTSKEVELVMYLLGERTPDFDKVFEQINEKMKEKINTTLEVKFLSWAEYEQKYPLLFASGEEFDIIYSADWAFYNSQATKQGFYEITQENLEKYAPLTAASVYPEAWEQAKVNGNVYMLPMNYKELSGYVYIVRGDLMEKYGIIDVTGTDGLEKYLDAVVKNGNQLIPIDVGSDYDAAFLFERMFKKATLGKEEATGPWQLCAYSPVDDKAYTLRHTSEYPEFISTITKLKDWKDRGFWSKSAVVNTTDNKDSFAAGRSAAAMMNLNTAVSQYSAISEAHPEWDIKVFDAMDGVPASLVSFMGNGMSIFSKSKNPERAMMAIDFLRNDEEINNLFCYGIEGEHYSDNGDGTITLLPANTNYGYDANCNWGVRNDATWKILSGGIPEYTEIRNKWLETAKGISAYTTFNFNSDSVKNQVAAMNDIFASDYKLLCLGFTADPAGDIAKMQEKLKAAGAEEVYAEMTKQFKVHIDNWNQMQK